MARQFDENKIKRHGKGSPEGGRFAPKNGGDAPRTKNEFDEKKVTKAFRKGAGVDKRKVDEAKLKNLAFEKFTEAKKVEPEITKSVSEKAKEAGGYMFGLKYRLKSEKSLTRKIRTDVLEDGKSLEQATKDIGDACRYTVHFESDSAFEEQVMKVRESLIADGWVPFKWKNYMMNEGSYRGLNTNWIRRDGTKFELQFHTPRTQAVKDKNHPLYELFRDDDTLPKDRRELENLMVANWAGVSMPEHHEWFEFQNEDPDWSD
jgi:hypothetical protein